jgi:hypothetical protein
VSMLGRYVMWMLRRYVMWVCYVVRYVDMLFRYVMWVCYVGMLCGYVL